MARTAKLATTEIRLAVIEVRPTGDRARYTLPVRAGNEAAAAERAARIAARIAAETGNAVRVDTHTTKAA